MIYDFTILNLDKPYNQDTGFGFASTNPKKGFDAARNWILQEYRKNKDSPNYGVVSYFGYASF